MKSWTSYCPSRVPVAIAKGTDYADARGRLGGLNEALIVKDESSVK